MLHLKLFAELKASLANQETRLYLASDNVLKLVASELVPVHCAPMIGLYLAY
jgi:hypothetical protein